MIAIPFIYFTFLAIYLMRRNGGIDISSFIVLIYAFSAFCSILLDIFDLYGMYGVYEKTAISPLATLCYCTLITLAVIPFRHIQSARIKDIDLQKEWIADALSWVLIITFFTTIISTFSTMDAVLHSDLGDVREDVYVNTEQEKLTGFKWFIALPEALFSQFSPVAIFLYFTNITKGRKSTLYNWLLLLASLTPVIKAILIAGRTQPIYWFLAFSALYIFFRPIMNKEQRQKALMPFAIVGFVVGLFIAAVTMARFAAFDTANDTGTFDSLITYSGQSFINFNHFFCNYSTHDIHFDRILPLTNYFIWHPGWNLDDYRDMIWSYSGLNIGVFFTFLGDLMIDLGHTGMVLYVLIFSLIGNYVCRTAIKDDTISLSRMLVVLILYLMPLQGIFYYSYYKTNIGYFIVGTLVLSWILSHRIKTKYES